MAGQTAENHIGGVDDDPVALDLAGLGGIGARHSSNCFLSELDGRESRSLRRLHPDRMEQHRWRAQLRVRAQAHGTKDQFYVRPGMLANRPPPLSGAATTRAAPSVNFPATGEVDFRSPRATGPDLA
ncbi:hypothetical protein GCM10022286_15850 [Gryllotalpicola daejeonensis]|uniref:Uncharacterized protein n=1 Tax=Gryllotalpicola daejeonensis TaxID=993087 RepID=A0ABP7ZJH7_9MICO